MSLKILEPVACIIMVLLFTCTAFASGPDTLWMRTWGSTGYDGAYSLEQTSDGGFIVGGWLNSASTNDDIYLIRTDPDGHSLWARTYGGEDIERAHSAQQTSDGGFVIAAHTYSFGTGGQDVYVIRTDASGSVIWAETYGGSGDDVGYSIQQTQDGGYIVAGSTNSFGSGGYDVYFLRLDTNGDTLWTRTYGGGSHDGARCVEQTSDGGYIIVGRTASYGVGGNDVWLIKAGPRGNIIWSERYGASWDDRGYSVDQTADGGYIVAGTTQLLNGAENDLYIVRTDPRGRALWTKVYGGSQTESGNSIQYLSDGGCIVAGWTRSFGAGFYDLYLVRTDTAGDTIWTQTYGGPGTDAGYCIKQASDGAYVAAGWTSSFGAGSHDVWLIRTEPDVAAVDNVIDPQGACFNVTISPNPSSGQGVLTWELNSPSPISLVICDILGREIREFADGYICAGKHWAAWDGTDSQGHAVPPGIYFVRLQAGNQVATRKIVLVR